ncbi:hypothetical protein QNO09_27165 [Streptomyces sp. 378]|uniref:hypothetical protein n=1 Tax=Streptomyces sp. 378 TaxID=3049412 RepID=UPI0024C41B0D|nr:hypothetical protein [Streptomyces sp. 378]MDK1346920.1 hypothetical protein [Streptomyces sp. 378]
MSEHLAVLDRVGLVRAEPAGHERRYRVTRYTGTSTCSYLASAAASSEVLPNVLAEERRELCSLRQGSGPAEPARTRPRGSRTEPSPPL